MLELGRAEEILRRYPLCDNCLGRMYARLGGDMSNRERGRIIKDFLLIEAELRVREGLGADLLRALCRSGHEGAAKLAERYGVECAPEPCYICRGFFRRIDEVADRAVGLLSHYEFHRFHVGSRIPGDMAEREDEVRSAFSLSHSESIKSEINRELGKRIAERTGAEVDFERPDVVVHYDAVEDRLGLEVRPIYIYGRYLKLLRGVRQTLVPGSGCLGPEALSRCPREEWSVEGLVIPLMAEAHGADRGVLHAAGREDVDVRMLGTGRPFVAEIIRPRRRTVDLASLERRINRVYSGVVAVRMLRYVDRDVVKKITVYSALHRKTYVLRVRFSGDVGEDRVRDVEERLSGAVVKQRTPTRVLWRRADKVRSKKVYSVRGYLLGGREAMFIITCQGGLYIKELATGDGGRTRPSIRDIVGVDVEVLSLDVVSVAPGLEERLFKP